MAAVKLRIGSMVVQLDFCSSAGAMMDDGVPSIFRGFVVEKGAPDIRLTVQCNQAPPFRLQEMEKIFDWHGPLSLYKAGAEHVLSFGSESAGQPKKGAVFREDFQNGDIFLPADVVGAGGRSVDWLSELSEFLLFTVEKLLGMRRGILIHGCAIQMNDDGFVFAGVSGAGKSTLANLWKLRNSAALLGDDRLIVENGESGFSVHSTIWSSDAGPCPAGSAQLKTVYFIEHSAANCARRLSRAEAVTRLIVRTFPPLFDRDGMHNTLDFCTNICETVPAFELGFVPDESVINFLESHMEAGNGETRMRQGMRGGETR